MSDTDHTTQHEPNEPQAGGDHKPRVPISRTVGDAYGFLFVDFARFFRFMWVPTLAYAVNGYVGHMQQIAWVREAQSAQARGQQPQMPNVGYADMALNIGIGLLLSVVMLLSLRAMIRYVMLGERVPSALGFRVDLGAVRFLLYTLAVVVVSYAVQLVPALMLTGYMASTVGSGSNLDGLAGVPVILGFIVLALLSVAVAIRLSFVPLTAAVDGEGRLVELIKWAWSAVRGNTIRLFAIMILIAIPFLIVLMFAMPLFLQKLLFGANELGILAAVMMMTIISMCMIYITVFAFCRAYCIIVWNRPDDESLATDTPTG